MRKENGMATQGLVTVRQNGTVKLKIVAGSDGYNAKRVATAIRKLGRVPTLTEAWTIASQNSFGDRDDDLVVMDERNVRTCAHPIPRLYRKTFRQPEFNPRWQRGTADHIEVVDI
jgi:hypothetical protein